MLIAYQFINALLIDRVELLFSLIINNSNKNMKNWMRNLLLICTCSFFMSSGDMPFSSVSVTYLLKIGGNSFIHIKYSFLLIHNKILLQFTASGCVFFLACFFILKLVYAIDKCKRIETFLKITKIQTHLKNWFHVQSNTLKYNTFTVSF